MRVVGAPAPASARETQPEAIMGEKSRRRPIQWRVVGQGVAFAGFLAAAMAGGCAAQAEDTGYLRAGMGALEVFRGSGRSFEGDLEFRPGWKLWVLQPTIGGIVTGDSALYGYVGVSADLFLSDNVLLRPSVAAGLYDRGNGFDLGNTLEFRSAIELAWQFENRLRLGVEFAHISNANLAEHNPGEESLLLTVSVPTSAIFGR